MLAAGALAMLLAMPLGSEMGAADHRADAGHAVALRIAADLLRWALLVMTAALMVWAGGSIF